MNEQSNTRLTRLAFCLMIAPLFIGLAIASVVAFNRGDWPQGVILASIFPGAILTSLLARWMKTRNLLTFEGMEGAEKRRAQTVSTFLQVAPLIFMFACLGLRKEMTAAEAFASFGRLFVIEGLLLIATVTILHLGLRWWDSRKA